MQLVLTKFKYVIYSTKFSILYILANFERQDNKEEVYFCLFNKKFSINTVYIPFKEKY